MTPADAGGPAELEARREKLRHRLARSRLRPGIWGLGVLWFLVMGSVTGSWLPALTMAAVAAVAAALSLRARRRDRAELERLERGPADP